MKFRMLSFATAILLGLFITQGFAQETAKIGADDEKTVTEELKELEKDSKKNTPPKILEAGQKGTEELRKSGILETALNVGGKMPSFSLYDASNKLVNSDDLLKQGHLVFVFYRGAWCPFCNLYLRGLQKNLPQIKEHGANLVAISVENPDRSLSVAQKNDLDFTILSDPNLNTARKFGIVYEMPKVTNDAILELGFDIAKYNGTEKAELPLSATYVINNKGEVISAFLDPDYKKRAEPTDIIQTLAEINHSSKKMKSKSKMKKKDKKN